MRPSVTVGLDLGGTKVLGVALDDRGTVIAEHRLPTPEGQDAVIDVLAEAAQALMSEAGQGADVATVGVGAPGLVDRGGTLRSAPNLPGVADLAIGRELGGRLSTSVRVENDATCAAWAERQLGAARGRDHVVVITLGTGIGGGLVLDGHLYRGAHGFSGEIGHMVVDHRGPMCSCGQRGCWERFASGTGLGRLGREAAQAGQAIRVVELAGGDPEGVRGEHVTRAALEGDDEARQVFRTFAWWLALGLANLANIFDPEAFVIGGGLIGAGDVLLEPARAAFAELVEVPRNRPGVEILPAQLAERAGAMGAALVGGED